jgi:hypothetical protein
LFIEDEAPFRTAFSEALRKCEGTIGITDIEGFKANVDGNAGSIEDQFANWLTDQERVGGRFDGALLDTDLSSNRHGISQSLARQALHKLGIPACRYSKKGATAPSDRLRLLKTLMTEGAQAVPFRDDISLATEQGRAAQWILRLFKSFRDLSEAIVRDEFSSKRKVSTEGPSGTLARAIGEPDAEVDFASYREAYPYYFADLLQSKDEDANGTLRRRQNTQLGYWFVNCILAFPGPILNCGATAAVLGLKDAASLSNAALEALLNRCRFTGPFAGAKDCYWRFKLIDCLDEAAVQEALSAVYAETEIEGPIRALRYCLVNNRPLIPPESPSRPDWIPAGAIESYIERGLYKKLNPWLTSVN